MVSDIHFDLHHEGAWRAFRRWHAANRPAETVLNGDIVDLGMCSRYPQRPGDPLNAIEQIRVMVAEVNALADEAGRVVVVEGNHDERWSRLLEVFQATALEGAVGLTLREQCRAQGLRDDVVWLRESTRTRGHSLGPFLVRHGHRQGSRFSPIHVAANRVTKGLGQCEIVGHHHRAQLFCRTAGARTAVVIANPCLTLDHEYAPDPDWQRGFTVVEVFDGPRHEPRATAYPVVMAPDGSFAWGGAVYSADPDPPPRARAPRAPQTAKGAKGKSRESGAPARRRSR